VVSQERITFDPETHTYTLDGHEAPSVTEITRFLHYKAEYADKESRDRAARRGTAIHELTELIDYGEQVEVPTELRGYIQAWENFKRDYRVKITAIESVVGGYITHFHVWELCGTVDRFAEIEGKFGIIDIKTGTKVNKIALQAQLNAYRMLAYEGLDMFMLGVYLKNDGTYTVYEVPKDDELVENLLTLHHKERSSRERWKITV